MHPSRLSSAFSTGQADAYIAHGLKQAAAELRLQIPRRKFHGLDAALACNKRDEKRADAMAAPPLEPQPPLDAPVERLTAILNSIPVPQPPGGHPYRNNIDRATLWSGPMDLSNNADATGSGIV